MPSKKSSLDFQIAVRAPTLEEYAALIQAAGWARYTNLEPIRRALEHSLFCVVAMRGNEVIGMGRLVGDGARFLYVQDMIVMPKHQKRGVGTAIMDRLMQYVNEESPNKTYVHLFTDRKTAPFYARYGFQGPEHPFYGMSVKKFAAPLRRKDSPAAKRLKSGGSGRNKPENGE